uniref:Uncharacterized protein n=1 Tax=Romanomermis culicivorax TaxID=13658 RepID=A0A915K372_ROMCU
MRNVDDQIDHEENFDCRRIDWTERSDINHINKIHVRQSQKYSIENTYILYIKYIYIQCNK